MRVDPRLCDAYLRTGYATRGFSIIVPGFDPELVCDRLKSGSFVYVEDKELLLRVTALGDSGLNRLKVDFANRSTCTAPFAASRLWP